MAIKIADAYIPILLDTSQLDAQLAEIESRIANIQAQAQNALSTANAANAALAAGGRGGGGGGGSAGGGGGLFSRAGDAFEGLVGKLSGMDITGISTLPRSLRSIHDPDGPGGSGVTFKEDLGTVLRLVGGRGKFGAITGGAAQDIGTSLMEGGAGGIDEAKGLMADAMRRAVDDAIEAGKDEADISSPSGRSAREIGSPIMQGIELEVMAGGRGVANAMINSIDFAFQSTIDNVFGGRFGNAGMTTVQDNPGGVFAGVPDYLNQLGEAVERSFAVGDPQNFGQSSRILASNFPDKARDFGQDILSGVVGSVVPGFAAGPLSDMLGTMLGTKPILTAEQALGSAVSADEGGLRDSPFVGGQFVFNNNFNNAGNFTETERAVQMGITQSMRRLGVGF